MAHVRAAHALLPEWLERGSGRFVSTVSAAGLLTMIGTAPYSVTKHGAYAFAEWLSLTYRHRGVRVHAICPQGVRTDMLDASGSAGDLVLKPTAIEPDDVADALFDGIEQDRFLILPHPEVAEYYRARATDPERWLGGMNRVQRQWSPPADTRRHPRRNPPAPTGRVPARTRPHLPSYRGRNCAGRRCPERRCREVGRSPGGDGVPWTHDDRQQHGKAGGGSAQNDGR